MVIVSISLSDELISEMDSLQNSLGIAGRSELVRAALKMMISDRKEKSSLSGELDSVLLTIHSDKYNSSFSQIRHEFESIIKTQLHSHMKNHKCLEILVLSGKATEIKNIYEKMQSNKKIDYAKLIVP